MEIKILDTEAGRSGYLPQKVVLASTGNASMDGMELGSALEQFYSTMAFDADLTVGAEGGDTINVAIQLNDLFGDAMTRSCAVKAYLSSDGYGNTLLALPPTGGVAIGTDGLLIPTPKAMINTVSTHGHLAITAPTDQFQTTQITVYTINGVQYTYGATDNLEFTIPAPVITASKFGVILVQLNAAGVMTTKVSLATQAYNNAALALAALPAPDYGNVALGYIAIENNAGDWTANTDDLTNGSDVTTAAFADVGEMALDCNAVSFDLVSESDGDIDLNIYETGVRTMYLALILPNGNLSVSGAITFA